MTVLPHFLVLIVFALLAPVAAAAGPLQRYTLIVGANNGGPDRPRLQYAVSDAERFARVMVELGGVTPENEIVLKDPTVGELLGALETLKSRIARTRRESAATTGRSEVFVYYSGHADEKGLLLGEDRLSYRGLRDRLDQMPADVRVAVLDACASGAFTRLKGGRARPLFLVDESTAMSGHAFLTSSSETEAAQESDRIRASYFTHFLVSGFRGAADMSGDGKVTLNEAYQFAFTETLGRTVDTKAGAQHPSYDINLSGTGDVVITDVGQTAARLVLAADLEGRFFVRTPEQGLVVELYKARGRAVEIGLEPGPYEIRVEHEKRARLAKVQIADGTRVVLDASQFGLTTVESTVRRGNGEASPFSVAGRSRLSLLTGMWGTNGTAFQAFGVGFDAYGGGQYSWHHSERLAFTAGVIGYGAEGQVDIIGGLAVPMGIQWNPRSGEHATQAVKPFIAVGVMPITSADSETKRRTTFGAYVGAGFDVHTSRSFTLGLKAGYNAVPELANPAGLHDNFKGLDITLGVGVLFGKGR